MKDEKSFSCAEELKPAFEDLEHTKEHMTIIPRTHELVSLDKHMPNAAHFAHHFTTTSIHDFIEYNNDNQGSDSDNASCFIDPDEMVCKTIFDLGNGDAAGHAYHKASLLMVDTAAYKALKNLTMSSKVECRKVGASQKELASFIEDWEQYIVCGNLDGKEIKSDMAVKAIQDVTVEKITEARNAEDDLTSSQSVSESNSTKNAKSIPVVMQFECNPYDGFCSRKFMCRISVITTESKPRFSIRIAQHQTHIEEMAIEFKSKIKEEVSNKKIYIGNMK